MLDRLLRPSVRRLSKTGAVAVLAVALVAFAGGLSYAGSAGETLRACVSSTGMLRESTEPCRSNEHEHLLVTASGLDALRAALAAATDAIDARLDALEATDADVAAQLDALAVADESLDGRVDALEAADVDLDARIDALEATDADHQAQIDALEARIEALALAMPTDVTFTKIFDGGHYASYSITGTGFRPGTTVTSGVGITETVAEDGSFDVFGGNLFCDRDVSVTGTAKDGSAFTRSTPVQCDNEPAATPSVTFVKIYDGGHYASYNITGEGFRPGSTVSSGVGTTATVASNGTFELFGGNLFCDRQVSVSGTANDGSAFSRTAPVECDSES